MYNVQLTNKTNMIDLKKDLDGKQGIKDFSLMEKYAEVAKIGDRFHLYGGSDRFFGLMKQEVYTVTNVKGFIIHYKRYGGKKIRQIDMSRHDYRVLLIPENTYQDLDFYRADQVKIKELTYKEQVVCFSLVCVPLRYQKHLLLTEKPQQGTFTALPMGKKEKPKKQRKGQLKNPKRVTCLLMRKKIPDQKNQKHPKKAKYSLNNPTALPRQFGG
ncbi:MAG: hypothetical protein EZS28_041823 [Streblomastix strix]|uniref:Uncharacterized protein n=1 Tax=Streblomastix strix TaxID=222440 RepID=A0A5J4TX60_9EUKA|nr:MAG: hypothetical protein EZS28_041823 [Streblomastix strix]